MGNHYFKFKQFTIHQDRTAMKVCTDACLQGAYTAHYLGGRSDVKAVLDIGTGTGLLSLMGAQQSNAHFTGIELDRQACLQATENFEASPWKARLTAICGDARAFESGTLFDFILTNPPFYEDDLKSEDAQRNQAMHATQLRFPALLQVIRKQLKPGGQCSVLLPTAPFAVFKTLAEGEGLYLQKLLQVRHREGHPLFRSIGIFGDTQVETEVQEMAIHGEGQQYSPAFTDLLKDYYLYL